jgi:chemotaxis protein methyltransferase CheR
MTLREARRALRGTSLDNWDMHIAASDVDTGVLAKAMRGVYPIDSVTDIDPDYRKRYLLRGSGPMSGQFKVKKEIAQNVEFQHLNLMDARWPLATTFDFIFFRNALIYFQQDVQDLFLRRMIRLLKPGGYLFLGHSENIPWLHDLVQPLQHTVYQVRGAR